MKLAYWPGCVRAASPRSCTARWRRSRRCWTSSWSSSTARTAAAPAWSPSTTRSSPTLSTPARSRMAQAVDGRGRDDEHLLHLPGRAVRVPERLDANSDYRGRGQLPPQARVALLRARATGGTRTSSGSWSRRSGSTRCGEGRARSRAAHRALLRLLHRAPHQAARVRPAPGARHVPRAGDRGARRRAGGLRRRPQVLRLPGDHDEPGHLAAPGRPPPGGRDRRRRGLPRHAVPALPPEPGHAAAGRREVRRARPRHSRAAPPADGRPRARLRAEGARDGQARRVHA